jgi:NAD(P)-dependent dehydrogenase (short-subunit alcohol dehydrogenase family)
MDLRLDGKVALVTGASYGIGLATAHALIREGMQVLGTSRTPPPTTPGLEHVPLDMTAADAGERAVSATIERFGRLDLVVNNVGSGRFGTGFAHETDDIWQQFWELNFMSAVRTTRAALPHLTSARGVVVNISSINGASPSTSIYAYSATKAALDNLTLALSHEVARHGVRVVGVAPGPTSTPLWLGPHGAAAQVAALHGGDPDAIVQETEKAIPIGRFARPEEIADLVAFLASPRSGSTTGTTITVDGGLRETL